MCCSWRRRLRLMVLVRLLVFLLARWWMWMRLQVEISFSLILECLDLMHILKMMVHGGECNTSMKQDWVSPFLSRCVRTEVVQQLHDLRRRTHPEVVQLLPEAEEMQAPPESQE